MNLVELDNELLQCFHENGHPEEVRTRSEVNQQPPKFRFAVARVWVVNDQGQIMCSQRGAELSSNACKWQTFFGGHVQAGRTIKETAQIELKEEAGILLSLEAFHLIEKGFIAAKKVFFESYAIKFDGGVEGVVFSDREIIQVKWMDLDEYWKAKEVSPDDWCNPCSIKNQDTIREWLQSLINS